MALVNQSAIDLFMAGGFQAGSDLGFYSTDGALTGVPPTCAPWQACPLVVLTGAPPTCAPW